MSSVVAAGRRILPRGWGDFGRQLGIWFGFALIYRWPQTRFSDEAVDAALTWLNMPAYRLRKRLFGGKTGPAASI